MWLHKLIDQVLYRGYEAAREEETVRIVSRYSRGNTSVQNGNLIDDAHLTALSSAGDRATSHVDQMIRAAKG